jgi:drug/metabolite transporter (DMT)-like permease
VQSSSEGRLARDLTHAAVVKSKVGALASPYLLLVLTILFWSGNFVVGRAVRTDIAPIALSFWRWAVALVVLLPFALPHVRTQWRAVLHSWRILVMFGILGVANFSTFVYIGLHSTTATNAVFVNSISPVVIVALSWMLLGQAIRNRQAVGIMLSLLGVIAIVMRGDLRALMVLQFNIGDLWVLAGVLSWALYSVYLKWRPAELHWLSFTIATVGVGVIVLLPFYIWEVGQGARFSLNLTTVSSVLYLGIFPSVLSYIFWNRAVMQVGANKAGQFMYLMPVFGTILSMLFLDEKLHWFHLVGISLIFFGIYLSTRPNVSNHLTGASRQTRKDSRP